MSLSDKEKRTVGIGTLVVVAALTYRALTWGDSLAAESSGNSIEGATLRIDQHDRYANSVESLSERLNVQINEASLGDQEADIRGDLAAKLKASGLQFKDLRRLDVKLGSRRDAINPIEFRIEVAGPFKSVMGFIGEAEASSTPYVVRAIQVSSSSPGAKTGGGKAPPPTGNVKAIMKIRGYLFPPGKAAEPEADPEPDPNAKPDVKPEGKTDANTDAKPEAQTDAKDASEKGKETPTPAEAKAGEKTQAPVKTHEGSGAGPASATLESAADDSPVSNIVTKEGRIKR